MFLRMCDCAHHAGRIQTKKTLQHVAEHPLSLPCMYHDTLLRWHLFAHMLLPSAVLALYVSCLDLLWNLFARMVLPVRCLGLVCIMACCCSGTCLHACCCPSAVLALYVSWHTAALTPVCTHVAARPLSWPALAPVCTHVAAHPLSRPCMHHDTLLVWHLFAHMLLPIHCLGLVCIITYCPIGTCSHTCCCPSAIWALYAS
jgi:hypothetical protein